MLLYRNPETLEIEHYLLKNDLYGEVLSKTEALPLYVRNNYVNLY